MLVEDLKAKAEEMIANYVMYGHYSDVYTQDDYASQVVWTKVHALRFLLDNIDESPLAEKELRCLLEKCIWPITGKPICAPVDEEEEETPNCLLEGCIEIRSYNTNESSCNLDACLE